MPDLDNLTTLQRYVQDWEATKGLDQETVLEKCLVLMEEVGEVAKAIRKRNGQKLATDSNDPGDVGEELADVLTLTCAIANRMGVDLTTAVERKSAKNRDRVWE